MRTVFADRNSSSPICRTDRSVLEQAEHGELGRARRVQQLADGGAALCLRQLPADIGGERRNSPAILELADRLAR